MASARRGRRPIVVQGGSRCRSLWAASLVLGSLAAIWLCWPATLPPTDCLPGSLAAPPQLDAVLGPGEWHGATRCRIAFQAGDQRSPGRLRWGVRDAQLWLAVNSAVPDATALAVHLDVLGGAMIPGTGRADGFVVLVVPGPAGSRAFRGGTIDAPARILYPPSASTLRGRDRGWELAAPLADLGLAPGGRFLFMIEVRGPASTHLWPVGSAVDQPVGWRRGRLPG